MSLKKSTLSASRWTSASTVLVTCIQVAQTAALARILLPAEFGLMAVTAALVAVLALFVDLGLSQALIHFDEVSVESRSSIYWLNISLALCLMLLLVAVAPIGGYWYHSPALVPLLQWTSLVFPLSALGQQLRAMAAKNLRFSALAPIDVAAAAAGLACAVAVALMGGGVYALVAGMLVNTATSSSLAWLLLPAEYRPGLHFRPLEAMPYLGFGGYLVGESLANSFHRNADVFAGGLVVGPAAMGIYSVPRDLNMRSSMVINSIVTKVGFPVMSQVKSEPERLRNIFLQMLRMTASVNFPMYVAIGLFASEIVALLYGPQWKSAATYLRILAAWGLLRSAGNPVGSLVYATGRTRRAFWWNLGLLVVLPVLYWLSTLEYGLVGLAAGMVAIQLLMVVPQWLLLVKPCCHVRLGEYLLQFLAPLLCALAAGCLAWLAAHDLPHGTLRLAVGFFVGATSYLALSWVFNRPWAIAMLDLLWPSRQIAQR